MSKINPDIQRVNQAWAQEAKIQNQALGIGLGSGAIVAGYDYLQQKSYLNSLNKDTVEISKFANKLGNETKNFIKKHRHIDKINTLGKGVIIAMLTGITSYAVMEICKYIKRSKEAK